jgi:2'-5' RNA ligase
VKNLTESLASADAKRPASMKNTDTARVFFALWPQPAIQRQLHAVAKEYQAKCNARVMRADTLHMTLQFIGNIKRADLPSLIATASKVTTSPFTLKLEKIAFWKHNGIAYATLKNKVPKLDELVTTLKEKLAAEGVKYADTKFNPHVTLMRNVQHAMQEQDFSSIEWQVDAFVLVESEITEKGAHYKILKEWMF